MHAHSLIQRLGGPSIDRVHEQSTIASDAPSGHADAHPHIVDQEGERTNKKII